MWAEYDNMAIESENNNYTLHVAGYHGNAGDGFNDDHIYGSSNGMQFSTPDFDNDLHPTRNCAEMYQSGWWHSSRCHATQLNGRYVRWYSPASAATGSTYVSATRMMLQCGGN